MNQPKIENVSKDEYLGISIEFQSNNINSHFHEVNSVTWLAQLHITRWFGRMP